MIITCQAHGRHRSDVVKLAAHLTKSDGQTVRVVSSYGLISSLSVLEQMTDMAASKTLSLRSKVGLQHLTINPRASISGSQRDQIVGAILSELRAERHAYVLIEHAGKSRALAGGSSTHWHLVIAHTGSNGRALRMSHSYKRLEALARHFEFLYENATMTPSRRAKNVAALLGQQGRHEIAKAVMDQSKPVVPASRMSSRTRQRAARRGIDLPAHAAEIGRLWMEVDPMCALQRGGFQLRLGKSPGIIIVVRDGTELGALHRIVRERKATVVERVGFAMAKRMINDNSSSDFPAALGRAENSRVGRRNTRDDGRDYRDPGRNGRGVDRDRRPHEVGSETRYIAFRNPPSGLRDPSSLRAIRKAEIAARVRRQRGRIYADELREVKRKLWARIVGNDISPEVAASLSYVDVSARMAHLIGGAWIRDDGDALYVSSADPTVVAVMVASAIAKGWQTVHIWGGPEFLAEARRQFIAAGIEVVDDVPPQTGSIFEINQSLARSLIYHLASRRKHLADRVFALTEPPIKSDVLIEAEATVYRHRIASWHRYLDEEKAQERLLSARENLERAGVFSRRSRAKELATAEATYREATLRFTEAQTTVKRYEQKIQRLTQQKERVDEARAAEAKRLIPELDNEISILDRSIDLLYRRPELALLGSTLLFQMAQAEIKLAAERNDHHADQHEAHHDNNAPKFGK